MHDILLFLQEHGFGQKRTFSESYYRGGVDVVLSENIANTNDADGNHVVDIERCAWQHSRGLTAETARPATQRRGRTLRARRATRQPVGLSHRTPC